MNTDFRISVTLTRHPKTRRLLRRLGHEAFYNLICLWTFTAVYKPKGVLTDMTAEEIEDAAEWTGEPGAFARTMVELRFLDVDDENGMMSIHDWEAHNSWASEAQERSERAKKAVNARWAKRGDTERIQADNTERIQADNTERIQAGDTERIQAVYTPSPSPSPTPNVKDVGAEGLPAGNPSTPAEPPDVPPEPFGIGVPLVDGTEYAVTRTDVEQWQESFPGVNVPQELRKIRAWADANPTRRKTRGGIRRHICAWLSREQDKGGSGSRASPSPLPGPADPRFMTPRQRYMHELGEALYPSIPEENPHEPVNITPPVRQLGAAER